MNLIQMVGFASAIYKTYNQGMTDKPSKPRGRPSIFRKVLGKGVNENLRFPAPIHALLKEIPVKRLLDWMAVDSAYKKKILEQVPEEDPPESIS